MKLPNRQAPEKIKEFAQAVLADRVWAWIDIKPPDLIPSVFMPVAFGALSNYTKAQLHKIAIFAIMGTDHSIQMCINGYPIFTSCRIWRLDDFKRGLELAYKMRAAQDAVAENFGKDKPHEEESEAASARRRARRGP